MVNFDSKSKSLIEEQVRHTKGLIISDFMYDNNPKNEESSS